MRLISARIENFGKLHQVSFDFVTGCQVFCEKNGWGKSTAWAGFPRPGANTSCSFPL